MGRGSSGASKGGGGGGASRPAAASTPSGVTVQQFQSMSEAQQIQTINSILANNSIVVPAYLDSSSTSKVMYALGMNNKPDVVSDSALDKMPGSDLYRTVYEQRGTMPPPAARDITDQIRNGEFTQLSGAGGSVHGRALYFASSFYGSASYGFGEKKPTIMRCKLKSTANIANESRLNSSYRNSAFGRRFGQYDYDGKALFAIAKGYDGWSDGRYTMILNRGALTASSQNKSIYHVGQVRAKNVAPGWQWAANVP